MGPSRRQILVNFNDPLRVIPQEDWNTVTRGINNTLTRANLRVRVTAGEIAWNGWALQTADVAIPKELDVVRGWITQYFPKYKNSLYLGLPQSVSYLKITNVPKYRVGSNLTSPVDINAAFAASPLREVYFPTGNPHIIQESPTSTSVLVFFNVWDSQSGACAAALNNKRINILGRTCYIHTTDRQPGVPFCTNCTQWGHPASACRQRRRCPICSGPHSREEHRDHAQCCKGHPKNKPHPIPPTPEGHPCPHIFRCPNCRKEGHPADSQRCDFWRARWDRAKIDTLYAKVHGLQNRGRRHANSTLP
jgi:hypothetical protein